MTYKYNLSWSTRTVFARKKPKVASQLLPVIPFKLPHPKPFWCKVYLQGAGQQGVLASLKSSQSSCMWKTGYSGELQGYPKASESNPEPLSWKTMTDAGGW